MATAVYFVLILSIQTFTFLIVDSHRTAFCVFVIQSMCNFIYLYKDIQKGGIRFLLSPSVTTLFYISFNCILGSLFFANGWILNTYFFNKVTKISPEILSESVALINCFMCSLCIIAKINYAKVKEIKQEYLPFVVNTTNSRLVILLILFVVISNSNLNFSFIGASDGNFNYPFLLGLVICISYELKRSGVRTLYRSFTYALIFLYFSVSSWASKREGFFVVIAIVLLESLSSKSFKLTQKRIALLLLVCIASIIVILASSQMRGYGNFEGESYLEAVEKIPEYVKSPDFNAYAANNFEFGWDYGHTMLALDYSISGRIQPLLGETFYKVLFVPLPKTIFGYKPRSMVDIYTKEYDSAFRLGGGSFPVMVVAEFYANFSYFSFILFILFYLYIENKYYLVWERWNLRKIDVSTFFWICFFSLLIQFVRGSGLELTLVYALMATSVGFICYRLNLLNY